MKRNSQHKPLVVQWDPAYSFVLAVARVTLVIRLHASLSDMILFLVRTILYTLGVAV